MKSLIITNVLVVIAACVFALILGRFIIPELTKLKIDQTEREEGLESHKVKSGTPTMGGVIFLIPFIVISILFCHKAPEIVGIIILTLGYGLIGFLDDFIKVVLKRNLGLRVWQKLVLQFAVTALFAVYLTKGTGISLDMRIPFSDGYLHFGIFSVPILFFIAIGTTNGTNFTDGVDGLCGSVTAVVAGFFAAAGIYFGSSVSFAASALLGALLGYLFYNVYPGKVMMGDTGSLAIGGFVTAIAYTFQMPIFIVIVGFIYAIEVVSVIIQVTYFKATHGKRFFRMAPIHHHFEKGGWSETRVVNVFTTLTIILALVGLTGIL